VNAISIPVGWQFYISR